MSELPQPDWMKGYVAKPAPKDGKWQKGQSGNPAGRPRGRPDARTKISRALMDDGLAVARVVIDAALEGDLGACGIVLSRIAPALRSQAEKIEFDFDATAPIAQQVEAVLSAIATGNISPDVGKQVIEAIKALADVRATEELEARIAALEEARPI